MSTKRIYKSNLIFLAVLIFVSCKESKTEQKLSTEDIQNSQKFDLKVGEESLKVILAILPEERQRGLMFVDQMESGNGMLFVFEYPSPQKFWMKNTRIPLDIGYFSQEGILKEVHAAEPFDLSGVPSNSKNIQFVLELNKNGFRKNKIRIGDRLNLNDIRNAIISRGLNPKKYQL